MKLVPLRFYVAFMSKGICCYFLQHECDVISNSGGRFPVHFLKEHQKAGEVGLPFAGPVLISPQKALFLWVCIDSLIVGPTDLPTTKTDWPVIS